MNLEAWALLVGILSAVFAVSVATAAILRGFNQATMRDVRKLRAEVEDLADDNDAIHGRLNERAARANLEKARSTKADKQTLIEQAAEIVKHQHAPTPPLDTEAQRAELRRKLLNS